MSKVKVSMALLLTALMVMSALALGCPPERPDPVVEPDPIVVPDPVEPPVRMGAWLDEIVAIVRDHDVAVPMIKAGDAHMFADDITDPDVFAAVAAHPQMGYEQLFGVFAELSLNPVGTPENPVFPGTGKLNPFAVPRIREAMNWLIDRDYIAEEIYKGMAVARYFALHPAFPDYARHIGVARKLELYYAHDPAKAEAIITEEMEKLGAERIDGIWHWNGEPVEIILLIRVEDARLPLGHYVTRLMEDMGFVTTQLLKTSGEASPIWLRGDPADGLFHIYTGGWIATTIDRDQADVFNFFYTPRGGWGFPLWLATQPAPEFCELADRLAIADFASIDERADMISRALELSMQDSHRIWVVNTVGFMPRRAEISLAADLAGGIAGSFLWALTTRFEDPVTGEIEVGGTATVAMPDLLTAPWNPIAGSAWIFDMMFTRATGDWGTMPDPFTGLHHPQRIERAEVYVREGLPVGVTLDWVDLQFVPPMNVPDDAWVDWCAVEQRFITLVEAREKVEWDTERAVADVRVRIHYPADLFDTVKWHDGSPLDIADIVMGMILTFDRAKEESPLFDEGAVPEFTTFMEHFRGVRIVSEDPLIIESYTNMAYLDAEWIAADWTWFPYFDHGPGAWHNLMLGIRAETEKELAFSAAKAGDLEIEWISFIAGESLPILERHLGEAIAAGFIPYAPTLGEFVTPAEAAARYGALDSWFEEKGHFWIGTGPFYLEAVHPIERIVELTRFPYFPDPAEKWVGFVAPRIAEVEVIGPTRVTAGDEAAFDIEVTFEGEPYPLADVDFVTYLLLDALGEIVHVGDAVAVRDGLWQVVLPAEKTEDLIAGSTRLEVVVSPLVVAIPTFAAATFVLLP